MSALLYFLPLVLFYLKFPNPQKDHFGLSNKLFDVKPYIIMWLIMIPLITWAATQQDFLNAYPRYKSYNVHIITGWDEKWLIGLFELGYGLNFVGLEFFFRVFLVLSMAHFIGSGAIYPMVSLYCLFHFGKPMAECISSIFGGFVLGIFAYNTRSIYGGIAIHLGVAFMMEIAAFIAKSL